MPLYVFKCISPEHKGPDSRVFEQFYRVMKSNKPVTQSKCPECGFPSPRSFADEGFTTPGLTPIYANHYTDTKGSINHEIAFAFGKEKLNPDGTTDPNAAPFASTGEMQKYLDGKNELGPPKLDDEGKPVRRSDGKMVRNGEKLFKYSPNAAPSRTESRPAPQRSRSGGWVDDKVMAMYGNGVRMSGPRIGK